MLRWHLRRNWNEEKQVAFQRRFCIQQFRFVFALCRWWFSLITTTWEAVWVHEDLSLPAGGFACRILKVSRRGVERCARLKSRRCLSRCWWRGVEGRDFAMSDAPPPVSAHDWQHTLQFAPQRGKDSLWHEDDVWRHSVTYLRSDEVDRLLSRRGDTDLQEQEAQIERHSRAKNTVPEVHIYTRDTQQNS